MNWRKFYKETNDVFIRCGILCAVMRVANTPQEISDVVDLMELLPIGLQSDVAWAVVNDPVTTLEIYNRVRKNAGLLARTSLGNVQETWDRNHVCASYIPMPNKRKE